MVMSRRTKLGPNFVLKLFVNFFSTVVMSAAVTKLKSTVVTRCAVVVAVTLAVAGPVVGEVAVVVEAGVGEAVGGGVVVGARVGAGVGVGAAVRAGVDRWAWIESLFCMPY